MVRCSAASHGSPASAQQRQACYLHPLHGHLLQQLLHVSSVPVRHCYHNKYRICILSLESFSFPPSYLLGIALSALRALGNRPTKVGWQDGRLHAGIPSSSVPHVPAAKHGLMKYDKILSPCIRGRISLESVLATPRRPVSVPDRAASVCAPGTGVPLPGLGSCWTSASIRKNAVIGSFLQKGSLPVSHSKPTCPHYLAGCQQSARCRERGKEEAADSCARWARWRSRAASGSGRTIRRRGPKGPGRGLLRSSCRYVSKT